MVVIKFERNNGVHTFKDAIVLPNDHSLSEQEIETIKDQRFADFLSSVEVES
jgi:hypothetical protein